MSDDDASTTSVKADAETRRALAIARREFEDTEAGDGRVISLTQTLRWLLEDCRPDLFGITPEVLFGTLSRDTRRAVRRLVIEELQAQADSDAEPAPVTFDAVLRRLISQVRPDIIAPDDV